MRKEMQYFPGCTDAEGTSEAKFTSTLDALGFCTSLLVSGCLGSPELARKRKEKCISPQIRAHLRVSFSGMGIPW